MKVLYYIQNVSHKEGSWLSLSALIKYVIGHNVTPVIVAPYEINKDSVFVDYCSSNNIQCYYVPIFFPKLSIGRSGLGRWIRLWMYEVRFVPSKYRCARQLYKIVKKEKPDIIHTNVGVLREGLWVAKFCKIPHVWHLREYQDLDFSWDIYPSKRVYERLLRKSDAIVTITDNIRSYFNLTGVKYAYTVYNGIEANVVREIQMPKEKYFLVASRIYPEKGILEIINVFKKFYDTHTNYKLVIAGDCSHEYAKMLVDKFANEESIIFVGWKNQTDLETLMSHATALVVNSRFEGLGRMSVESILRGSLVIGKDVAGTKEIRQKVGGVLGYNNEHGLLTCMENVCNINEEQYRKLILEAQDKAKVLFSIEKNGEKIMNVYDLVLKS